MEFRCSFATCSSCWHRLLLHKGHVSCPHLPVKPRGTKDSLLYTKCLRWPIVFGVGAWQFPHLRAWHTWWQFVYWDFSSFLQTKYFKLDLTWKLLRNVASPILKDKFIVYILFYFSITKCYFWHAFVTVLKAETEEDTCKWQPMFIVCCLTVSKFLCLLI